MPRMPICPTSLKRGHRNAKDRARKRCDYLSGLRTNIYAYGRVDWVSIRAVATDSIRNYGPQPKVAGWAEPCRLTAGMFTTTCLLF